MNIFSTLQSDQIVGMILYPYLHLGLQAVHLEFASARTITVRARAENDSPLESYSLEAIEERSEPTEGVLGAPQRYKLQLPVDRIEIFRRSEWAEDEAPTFPTVGSNPVSIDTGPVGSAPAGARSTTVVCAVAFGCKLAKSQLLIFLVDTPGLVGLARDDASLLEFYRSGTTAEIFD